MERSPAGGLALVLSVALAASCAGSPERPAPAGADSAARTANVRTASRPAYAEPDVDFMQGMIMHHAQALLMADMVPARTDSDDIRTLARRIDATQEAEIALMGRWLESRGERVPDVATDHGLAAGDHGGMPGMLTEEELDRLAGASGDEFDRLFLELMISHHQGALVMVANLLSTENGGQEPEIFRFASNVDADQRAEIARMQNLLTALERGSQ